MKFSDKEIYAFNLSDGNLADGKSVVKVTIREVTHFDGTSSFEAFESRTRKPVSRWMEIPSVEYTGQFKL